MGKRYLYQWFIVEVNGVARRAKCIDIEFNEGLRPLFLMEEKLGRKFWMTKRDMEEAVWSSR